MDFIKLTFYYVEPATGNKKEVPTPPQANLTVLNFNRPPIQGVPVIGPSTTESLIHFVYTGRTASGGGDNQYRMLQAKINYWSLSTTTTPNATYALRSPAVAWNELLAGKGYVLSQSQPQEEINIRKIYMAYFEPEKFNDTSPAFYLQPVWVFEGDKTSDTSFLFRAVVPAVSEGYTAAVQ